MNNDNQERGNISTDNTTGHEWDGIKELNNPAPRWWLIVFFITVIWAVGYWIWYPAWPTVSGHTKGIKGWTQYQQLTEQNAQANKLQEKYLKRFNNASLQDILNDKELMEFAIAGGKAFFKDNCATCHGADASGSKGFPNLNDDDWLWGGQIDDIYQTIKFGVRSTNPHTRASDMPAFGKDGILDKDQILSVVDYTVALPAGTVDHDSPGGKVFAANCAVCHGAKGEGNQQLGAPRLNDQIWLYGGDKDSVLYTINNSRQGVMPSWIDRLSDNVIKQLAIYVYSLGGG